MSGECSLTPVGTVRSPRAVPAYDHWGSVESEIHLDPQVLGPDATAGLEDFSHLEVVFRFHLLDGDQVLTGAAPPRGLPGLPAVGVLAQRAKERPNHLGVSRCELVGVDGLVLRVRRLDALDGTPVLDVKPHLRCFVPADGAVREPGWVREVMRAYY